VFDEFFIEYATAPLHFFVDLFEQLEVADACRFDKRRKVLSAMDEGTGTSVDGGRSAGHEFEDVCI
jgi:hypothetical protein